MENKSLNIFNTSCVCASPATATDADFERVQGIVAHECESRVMTVSPPDRLHAPVS